MHRENVRKITRLFNCELRGWDDAFAFAFFPEDKCVRWIHSKGESKSRFVFRGSFVKGSGRDPDPNKLAINPQAQERKQARGPSSGRDLRSVRPSRRGIPTLPTPGYLEFLSWGPNPSH